MSEKTCIIINDLSRSYGKTLAIDAVSFSVGEGEIFGLIGPDGAGKTTLFRILTTLLLPDGGNASVMGYDCVKEYKQIRKIIGYMPGKFSLYQDLTVEENLNFYATVFQTTVKENYHLIEDIYRQIEPFKNRRAGKLSGGMKQKLALCCALVHKPKVLFLDEPTTGVDAVSRKEFWEMLHRLKKTGLTILVSTPYMDEAVRCDRVGFIQNGKILQIGKPDDIVESFPLLVYSVTSNNPKMVINELGSILGTENIHRFGNELHIYGDNMLHQTLTEFAQSHKTYNIEFRSIDAGVEDCFIELMKSNNVQENE